MGSASRGDDSGDGGAASPVKCGDVAHTAINDQAPASLRAKAPGVSHAHSVERHESCVLRINHPPIHPPGTFTSVKVLITQIRDDVTDWNTTAKPFTWAATTDEIL